MDRRRFLRGAAVAGGALAVGAFDSLSHVFAQSALPPPAVSGLDHIVVVMMENRSFDHCLGWLDGAEGRQRGLTYLDAAGVPHRTYPLAPDYEGCGHADPDHSYDGGRVEFNGGACDGWLRAGDNDEYAIGFYTKKDLPFLGTAARRWTTCDSAIMAGTFANRVYQHAAQTDRLGNTFELSTLPTIWDRLASAGIEGRYYFSDVPFLALWGAKYLPIGRLFDSFLDDAAAGTLPAVSFVEPRFIGEAEGLSNDDHPFADIRNGEVSGVAIGGVAAAGADGGGLRLAGTGLVRTRRSALSPDDADGRSICGDHFRRDARGAVRGRADTVARSLADAARVATVAAFVAASCACAGAGLAARRGGRRAVARRVFFDRSPGSCDGSLLI